MLEQSLQVVVNRETRRTGTQVVVDPEQLKDLLNKQTNVMTNSAFEKGEIIELTPDKAVLMEGAIRGNNNVSFRLLVKTNKGTKNLFLTTFYKSRVLVKDNLVTSDRIDNYDSEVGRFYAECPTQLIFLAAILGCKMVCDNVTKTKVAGYDPQGGPNRTGGTDTDPSHAVNATFPFFKFSGKKPEIKEEWLEGDGVGDTKAAEYIVNFFAEKK